MKGRGKKLKSGCDAGSPKAWLSRQSSGTNLDPNFPAYVPLLLLVSGWVPPRTDVTSSKTAVCRAIPGEMTTGNHSTTLLCLGSKSFPERSLSMTSPCLPSVVQQSSPGLWTFTCTQLGTVCWGRTLGSWPHFGKCSDLPVPRPSVYFETAGLDWPTAAKATKWWAPELERKLLCWNHPAGNGSQWGSACPEGIGRPRSHLGILINWCWVISIRTSTFFQHHTLLTSSSAKSPSMAQPKLLLMQLRTLFQRPFEAWEEGKEQITLANASSNPPPKRTG